MCSWVDRLRANDKGRHLLEQERVILEATEGLCRLMEEQQLTKADLARRMDVSTPYVTKLLSGGNNATLRSLASAYLVLGRSLHIEYGPAGDGIRLPAGVMSRESRAHAVFVDFAPQPDASSGNWDLQIATQAQGREVRRDRVKDQDPLAA